MYENKNEQNTGTKTIKKIGKVTYEVVVHFNENATETMQDKLKRIMLREMEREKHHRQEGKSHRGRASREVPPEVYSDRKSVV